MASGMPTTMERKNPQRISYTVTAVWSPRYGHSATNAERIPVGAGRRYSGSVKPTTTASQTTRVARTVSVGGSQVRGLGIDVAEHAARHEAVADLPRVAREGDRKS